MTGLRSWSVWGTLLLVVSLAVPAVALGEEALAMIRPEIDERCEDTPLRPFTALDRVFGEGDVVGHFQNEGPAVTGRVCAFDWQGAKRIDMTIAFPAESTTDVTFEAPPGIYTFRLEFYTDTGSATGRGTLNTRWCPSHDAEFYESFSIGPGMSIGGHPAGCELPGSFVVGALGLVGSAGLFVLAKFPHLAGVALYSRLARPRILDHEVRARVMDLVAREPGIHTRAIVRALSAGHGQTAYHLGVLARERHLTSIGVPGRRHWFPSGRFSAPQMRAQLALQDPTRRRLYDQVVADPGASLSDLARRAQVSLPQGSRAAATLERVGLIERRREGRALRLLPRAPS